MFLFRSPVSTADVDTSCVTQQVNKVHCVYKSIVIEKKNNTELCIYVVY